MKKILANLLKLIVSGFLLYILFRRINFQLAVTYLRGINLINLLPGFCIYTMAILLSTIRWVAFLKTAGFYVKFGEAFKYYLIGIFAGNFLPSGGLDIVRAYYAGRKSNLSKAFAVTLLDRLAGFYAILFFLVLNLLFITVKNSKLFYITFAGITILLLGNIVIFSKSLGRFLLKVKPTKFTAPVIDFLSTLHSFRENYTILLKTMPVSILIQIFFSLTPWVLAQSIHTPLPIVKTILILPIVNFVMMIPVTISGLGLREGAFIVIYGNDIGNEKSLIISLLYYTASLVLSLAGMFLFLLDKSKKDFKKLD
ncbi:MAG: lysylphosphatidylglycerol synthase transmembrane domain-containing protein [candidate division WOR-3 bacterium]